MPRSGGAGTQPRAASLAFPSALIGGRAPHTWLTPFAQVCTHDLLCCPRPQHRHRGARTSRRTRSPLLGLVSSSTHIHGTWVPAHSLCHPAAAPRVTRHPMTLPFTPPTPHPRARGPRAGRRPVKTSFTCSILFINQKIQNNHHSVNAQAPCWPPHPQSHTLLSRSPHPAVSLPLPQPRDSPGRGWGGAGGGRGSTGQTDRQTGLGKGLGGRFLETKFNAECAAQSPGPFRSFPIAQLRPVLPPLPHVPTPQHPSTSIRAPNPSPAERPSGGDFRAHGGQRPRERPL